MKILWCKREAEQAVRLARMNCDKLNIELKPELDDIISYLPYAMQNEFFMGVLINFVKHANGNIQAYFYVPAFIPKDESEIELMESVYEDDRIIHPASTLH